MQLETRIRLALFLVLTEIVSNITLDYFPRDDTYYVVCGFFNTAVILLLPILCKKLIIIDFQLLNLAELFVQALGFVIYWQGYPIELYNYSIYLITILIIIRLIIVKRSDIDGFWEDNYWSSLVNYFDSNFPKILSKKETL